jgi:ABC-type transport system substrate-binding protein
MLQADLAKVGLKLDIRVMEWGEMLRAPRTASRPGVRRLGRRQRRPG